MKKAYKIRFAPRFSKGFTELNKQTQIRILREINALKANPHLGKPLRGEWKGVYSLRTDPYRVLYQVRGNEVLLLIVRHRKHVYK